MKPSAYILVALLLGQHLAAQPTRLTVELLEHTDRVWKNGYVQPTPVEDAFKERDAVQLATVHRPYPCYGWMISERKFKGRQTAYQIQVASSRRLLEENRPDVWDSRQTTGAQSNGIRHGGQPLNPDRIYYWRVKVWDERGRDSGFSTPKAFVTAKEMDGSFARYPLEKTDESPVRSGLTPDGTLYDFGTDAFSQLTIHFDEKVETPDTLIVHLGECRTDGAGVDRKPGGSLRYARYAVPLHEGQTTYHLTLIPDERNTKAGANESGVSPILMPDYIGEVYPFRYCEIEGKNRQIRLTRHAVHEPFDEQASAFTSSDSVLNKVWDLCKYSMKATSFCGTYVDGDRERIPYEADAYVNQLTHYAVDREYSMARHSIAHLIFNPTWPTEWILLTPLMAWNDYLYTGDASLIETYREDLGAKTLPTWKDARGLISKSTDRDPASTYQSVHFKGRNMRNIVDWPQSGAEGIEKEYGGETDGFVLKDFNTVVNAYHYAAMESMRKIAHATGHEEEAARWQAETARFRDVFDEVFFDTARKVYIDGIGTDHASQHANMFPLAFGIVKPENVETVRSFIESRRMACSVYGAQFLLDALFDHGGGQTAAELLHSTGKRSWYNMLRIGSTITTEAWDNVFKPNQDWNHAWGAAAGNVIARKLMGVEPALPGFEEVNIHPHPGDVQSASLVQPTVRGDIKVSFNHTASGRFVLTVEVPRNTTAHIRLPYSQRDFTVGSGTFRFKEKASPVESL